MCQNDGRDSGLDCDMTDEEGEEGEEESEEVSVLFANASLAPPSSDSHPAVFIYPSTIPSPNTSKSLGECGRYAFAGDGYWREIGLSTSVSFSESPPLLVPLEPPFSRDLEPHEIGLLGPKSEELQSPFVHHRM